MHEAGVICQRCGGRLTLNQDRAGRFAECLTCGNEVQLDNEGRPLTALGYAAEEARREPFAGSKLWRNPPRGKR